MVTLRTARLTPPPLPAPLFEPPRRSPRPPTASCRRSTTWAPHRSPTSVSGGVVGLPGRLLCHPALHPLWPGLWPLTAAVCQPLSTSTACPCPPTCSHPVEPEPARGLQEVSEFQRGWKGRSLRACIEWEGRSLGTCIAASRAATKGATGHACHDQHAPLLPHPSLPRPGSAPRCPSTPPASSTSRTT